MATEYIRFKGKVSFVEKHGKSIAKASYLCPETRKRKQVWRTVTGKKSDAKDAVIAEIERRLNKKEERQSAKTFDDLADYFEANRAIPAVFVENVKIAGMKTYKNVRADIKILRNYFGNMPLASITRDSIIKFRLAELAKPVRRVQIIGGEKQSVYKQKSLATVHHQIRTMQSCMNAAVEIGWLDRLPSFKGLASIATENKREKIPTDEEFARLLKEVRKARQPLLMPLVLFIADCGARPTEIYSALWTQLDLENQTITLISDKGKKRNSRIVGLTAQLIEEINKIPRTNEFILGGIKSVKNSWNKAKKRAGFNYDLYSLRKLFASRLDRLGLPDITKSKLMGHADVKMTSRYTELMPKTLKEIAEKLEQDDFFELNDIIEEK